MSLKIFVQKIVANNFNFAGYDLDESWRKTP